jgi:putative inorganic carbon (hco3(-)) transporter
MTFTLFVVYVVLSYIHPGQLVPALAPYRVTYWVAAAGLAVAIASLLANRKHLAANLQLWGVIGFTIVMVVSLTIAERWLGAPIMVLQRFGPSLAIFLLAICGVTSLARFRTTTACVIGLTTILVLQGAAAYHFGYNSRLFLLDRSVGADDGGDGGDTWDEGAEADPFAAVWDEAGTDEWEGAGDEDPSRATPRIRALGFMHDPNDLAMGLIVALGLIGGMWKPAPQLRNVMLAAIACVLVYGIFLTRSRGGAIALVVVVWRFAARYVGQLPAFLLLVTLGAGVMALDFGGRALSTELDESASERIVAWTEGFEMLKEQPLLGVGYGGFIDRHTLTAHNSLVLCFAETGLIGCFLWVGLLVVTLLELQGVKSLHGGEPFDEFARQGAEGLQLALIGFMAAAFFLSRTFVPTLYLVIGLSAALVVIVRAANRPVFRPALPELGMLAFACEIGGIGIVYTMVKLHVA